LKTVLSNKTVVSIAHRLASI